MELQSVSLTLYLFTYLLWPSAIKRMSPWDETEYLTYPENPGIADQIWEQV